MALWPSCARRTTAWPEEHLSSADWIAAVLSLVFWDSERFTFQSSVAGMTEQAGGYFGSVTTRVSCAEAEQKKSAETVTRQRDRNTAWRAEVRVILMCCLSFW